MNTLRKAMTGTASLGALSESQRGFVSQLKATQIEVYRVTLTTRELERAGMHGAPDDQVFDKVVKPLLIKKGVPDRYLYDGAPFRASETPEGLVLEFD